MNPFPLVEPSVWKTILTLFVFDVNKVGATPLQYPLLFAYERKFIKYFENAISLVQVVTLNYEKCDNWEKPQVVYMDIKKYSGWRLIFVGHRIFEDWNNIVWRILFF